MPRLDINSGDYLVEIKDQFSLFGTMQAIQNNIVEIQGATDTFIAKYEDKKFLWEEELETYFANFLNSGPDIKEEFIKKLDADRDPDDDDSKYEDEIESFNRMAEKILCNVVTRKPDLDVFDIKIQDLTTTKHNINQMKLSDDIGWLRVNSTPLIKDLQ